MPRMADGRSVVADVRADDRMRAASAPFATGKVALRWLAQSIPRELATCLDQVPKKKYRRAAKETGLAAMLLTLAWERSPNRPFWLLALAGGGIDFFLTRDPDVSPFS